MLTRCPSINGSVAQAGATRMVASTLHHSVALEHPLILRRREKECNIYTSILHIIYIFHCSSFGVFVTSVAVTEEVADAEVELDEQLQRCEAVQHSIWKAVRGTCVFLSHIQHPPRLSHISTVIS